jgi:hypothetical protein
MAAYAALAKNPFALAIKAIDPNPQFAYLG